MLKRSSLLYASLLLTIILAALHFAANAFYLYWYYWWYDYMMHFLAGLAGGLSAYWMILHSGLWRRKTDAILVPLLAVFLSLMIVGVAWEVMEYTYGLTDAHELQYFDDVTNDLIMDALGAITAVAIGVRQTFFRHV